MLRKGLVGLQGIPGLKAPDRKLIEDTLLPLAVRPKPGFTEQLMAQVESDLRNNTQPLKLAVVQQLNKVTSANLDYEFVVVEVEELSSRVFQIKSNLAEVGFSPEMTHKLFDKAIAAVCNLNHRVADMEAFGAITGFLEAEAPLLFGKFASIISPLNPSKIEGQFERVIEISGLPDVHPHQRIDVKRLLEVRNSAELTEFRQWLSTTDGMSDAEITKMISSVKSKLSSILSNPAGKVARFVTTTAIGMIPGLNLVVPVAAGAIDSFLVDKVLPRSGISAFVTEIYPSLFLSS